MEPLRPAGHDADDFARRRLAGSAKAWLCWRKSIERIRRSFRMPQRIAFRMNLNPGQAEEYRKRHDEIWPELSQALKDAGISDYSIWLDPETNHLFATLIRSDDHTMPELPKTEINKRWWAFMADVMDYNQDGTPVQVELKQVFQLD
jgi:L-rhamnose mutarotase